jgi:hypothetical protein
MALAVTSSIKVAMVMAAKYSFIISFDRGLSRRLAPRAPNP